MATRSFKAQGLRENYGQSLRRFAEGGRWRAAARLIESPEDSPAESTRAYISRDPYRCLQPKLQRVSFSEWNKRLVECP